MVPKGIVTAFLTPTIHPPLSFTYLRSGCDQEENPDILEEIQRCSQAINYI